MSRMCAVGVTRDEDGGDKGTWRLTRDIVLCYIIRTPKDSGKPK